MGGIERENCDLLLRVFEVFSSRAVTFGGRKGMIVLTGLVHRCREKESSIKQHKSQGVAQHCLKKKRKSFVEVEASS